MATGSKEEEHGRGRLEEASRTGFRVFLQECAEDMPQVSKMFPKATPSSTDWFLIWPGGGSSTTRDSENAMGCHCPWSHRTGRGRSELQGVSLQTYWMGKAMEGTWLRVWACSPAMVIAQLCPLVSGVALGKSCPASFRFFL